MHSDKTLRALLTRRSSVGPRSAATTTTAAWLHGWLAQPAPTDAITQQLTFAVGTPPPTKQPSIEERSDGLRPLERGTSGRFSA